MCMCMCVHVHVHACMCVCVHGILPCTVITNFMPHSVAVGRHLPPDIIPGGKSNTDIKDISTKQIYYNKKEKEYIYTYIYIYMYISVL